MGRLNRQRRAEKRRRAAKQQPFRQRQDRAYAYGAPLRADQLVAMAAVALRNDRADDHAEAMQGLRRVDAAPGGSAGIEQALISSIEGTIAALWEDGWQPADVAHVVGRRLGASGLTLAQAFIAGEARSYCDNGVPVEPWWQAQLDELGVVPPAPGELYLAVAGRRAALAWWTTVESAVGLLAEMWSLHPLERLGPPPRTWGREGAARRPRSTPDGIDERILNRVRALLAKAESTEFPEEADALTVKAQELMARHAIDLALVDTGTSTAEPIGRRLGMDDPYADEKAYLLAVIADANRCRAVLSSALALPTIMGFPSDLDATELLFTSLLVQASTSLRLLGASAPPGSRQRGTAFRRSFYVGFAGRIGERLRTATAVAVDDAVRDHGDRLLPVLARRDDAVDDAVNELFPGLTKKGIRASDGAGISAGRLAADHARLATGAELEASA